jgi:serine protease Do
VTAGIAGLARAFTSNATVLADELRRVVVEVRSGRADGEGSGSGIVWGGAGLVVTNAHVAPRGSVVEVDMGGTRRDARVIAHQPQLDLALLDAPFARGPFLVTRRSSSLRAGELVFAHGHPLGVRDALAMGVVHGVARESRTGEPRWVIADVRLAPGNSGGPLVDAEGRLVGINSMIVNGLGVAIPAELVQHFVENALARRAA